MGWVYERRGSGALTILVAIGGLVYWPISHVFGDDRQPGEKSTTHQTPWHPKPARYVRVTEIASPNTHPNSQSPVKIAAVLVILLTAAQLVPAAAGFSHTLALATLVVAMALLVML